MYTETSEIFLLQRNDSKGALTIRSHREVNIAKTSYSNINK